MDKERPMRAIDLPTIEVVLHRQYGAFHLSKAAIARFNELATDIVLISDWPGDWDKIPVNHVMASDVPRHHPALVQVVRELGDDAHFSGASKPRHGKIFEIETISMEYHIDDYDGRETLSRRG